MGIRKPVTSLFHRKASALARNHLRGSTKEIVTSHPAFKRTPITPAEIIELRSNVIKEIRFNSDAWFKRLKKANGSDYVRVLPFKEKEFVVKYTQERRAHGDYEGDLREHPVRKFMHALNKRLQKIPTADRRFIIRTPRIYFRERQFLVLEKISEYTPKTEFEKLLIQNAQALIRTEFERTMEEMTGLKIDIKKEIMPQVTHIWCAGIFKGKPVFYVPYDYV